MEILGSKGFDCSVTSLVGDWPIISPKTETVSVESYLALLCENSEFL